MCSSVGVLGAWDGLAREGLPGGSSGREGEVMLTNTYFTYKGI